MATTSEEKSEVWHRVRREGRQDAFAGRKAQLEREYLKDGKSQREAIDLAWTTAINEFPPLVLDASTDDKSFDRAELAAAFVGKQRTREQILCWVFEHLDDDELTIQDSIGFGSWSLLQWARSSRSGFYRLFFSRLREWPVEDDGNENQGQRKMTLEEFMECDSGEEIDDDDEIDEDDPYVRNARAIERALGVL
jgi:hypothetical protein